MKVINNQKSKDVNISSLDGLRFVVISLLVMFHMGYPVKAGAMSISFFLILSGYVMGYSSSKS